MYFVAGVTGHTGATVADTLLKHGKEITVLVRSAEKGADWSRKGANVAVADLGDADALAKALNGAEGAFLLLPPGYEFVNGYTRSLAGIAASMAKAVATSKVPHVVLLSSEGAHLDSRTGPIITNHDAEKALKATPGNLTVVRAAYFIENFESVLGAARDGGVLPTFLTPDRKIPMVATRDIGRVAAESLLDPARGRRVIELAGPEDYSPEDIALSLSTVFGRDVKVQAAPVSAAPEVLQGEGLSEELALLLAEMTEGINAGRIDFERTGAEFKRGVVTPVDVFARAAK